VSLVALSASAGAPASPLLPHLARYIRGLRARPSFIELNAREGLTEWRNEDD
jgi:hypothetical protein